MATIPQRELRNNVSEVLRRAEAGERLTVTVDGRPVAELGPVSEGRRLATPSDFARVLSESPVDTPWAGDLRQMREEETAAAAEPWPD